MLKRIKKEIFGYSHQRKSLERTNTKWEIINSYLPDKPGSLFDIGCNEGFFTRNASKKGWCAWGIDINKRAIKYATDSVNNKELAGVYFSKGGISPEVAKKLPKYDVIILVSIFQEICSLFGLEKGYELMDSLLAACNNRIFFEPSSINSKYGKNVKIFDSDNDLASVEKWVNWIVSRNQGWKFSYIGKTPYTIKEDYRFMFLIEKQQ